MPAQVRARDADRHVDPGARHRDDQDAAKVRSVGRGHRLELRERRPDRRGAGHVEPHAADIRLVEDGGGDQLDGDRTAPGARERDGVLGGAGPAPRPDGDADALEPGPRFGLEEGLAAFGPGGRGMQRQRRLDARARRRRGCRVPDVSALDERAVRGGRHLERLEERHARIV